MCPFIPSWWSAGYPCDRKVADSFWKSVVVANILGSYKKGWFDGNFLGRKKIMPFPAAKVSHECQIWHLSYEVIAWKLYYSYFFRGNRDQTGDFNARRGVKKVFYSSSTPMAKYNSFKTIYDVKISHIIYKISSSKIDLYFLRKVT